MVSKAPTVAQFLKECAPRDRKVLTTLRALMLDNLQPGFVETMAWGMPTYQVPVEQFVQADGEPLVYAALDAEKRGCAIYLTALYNDSPAEADFRRRWRSPSKRTVEFRTTSVHFRELRDVDLPLVAEFVRAMSPEEFVASYHRSKD